MILVTITKNEETTLPRLLASTRDHVRRAMIFDTGSTDDTFDVAARANASVERITFSNFSHARNAAIRAAEGTVGVQDEYLLLLDADMTLEVSDPAWKGQLTADLGMVKLIEGDLEYRLPLIRRVGCGLWYSGFTHEALETPANRFQLVEGIAVYHHADGGSRADKYQRDLILLRQQLEANPGDPRATYYLARTHWCLGDLQKAAQTFWARWKMSGGWEEERWHAGLCYARCVASIGQDDVRPIFLEVWAQRPDRSEPIADLMRQVDPPFRARLADLIRGHRPPADAVLFVEPAAYSAAERHDWLQARDAGSWGIADRIAIAAVRDKLAPRTWWYRALIQSAWNCGRTIEALEWAEKGLALVPGDEGLLHDRAAMLVANGS